MKTYHFRLSLLDDRAHAVTERWEIRAGAWQRGVDPELAIIGRQALTPGLLAVSICFRRDVTEEVNVDRLVSQRPQLLDCLRYELGWHRRATDRAQAAGGADGSRKLDR